MRATGLLICGAFTLASCGGGQTPPTESTESSGSSGETAPGEGGAAAAGAEEGGPQEFVTSESDTAGSAHGATPSQIEASASEAAMRLFVVDKETKEPIPGIVIVLEGPDGQKYYTGETDSAGYGEVLVPVASTYQITYLSLGMDRDVKAKVKVSGDPNQDIKLTMRYKRLKRKPADPAKPEEAPVFRLDGVTFASGSAKLLPDSFERLDGVVEYMTYKKSARIEISGHTDNVGVAKKNKALSKKRADACRDYLVSKGIDASRIETIGHGSDKPVASNDTEAGRQKNRRIEAREL